LPRSGFSPSGSEAFWIFLFDLRRFLQLFFRQCGFLDLLVLSALRARLTLQFFFFGLASAGPACARTLSAIRSASCSNLSPGLLTVILNWTAGAGADRRKESGTRVPDAKNG
jgi:hypothetical protein